MLLLQEWDGQEVRAQQADIAQTIQKEQWVWYGILEQYRVEGCGQVQYGCDENSQDNPDA
jgi:hypothetical protein